VLVGGNSRRIGVEEEKTVRVGRSSRQIGVEERETVLVGESSHYNLARLTALVSGNSRPVGVGMTGGCGSTRGIRCCQLDGSFSARAVKLLHRDRNDMRDVISYTIVTQKRLKIT